MSCSTKPGDGWIGAVRRLPVASVVPSVPNRTALMAVDPQSSPSSIDEPHRLGRFPLLPRSARLFGENRIGRKSPFSRGFSVLAFIPSPATPLGEAGRSLSARPRAGHRRRAAAGWPEQRLTPFRITRPLRTAWMAGTGPAISNVSVCPDSRAQSGRRARRRPHFPSVNGAVMRPMLALVMRTQSKSCFSPDAPVLPVFRNESASCTALAAKVATG